MKKGIVHIEARYAGQCRISIFFGYGMGKADVNKSTFGLLCTPRLPHVQADINAAAYVSKLILEGKLALDDFIQVSSKTR